MKKFTISLILILLSLTNCKHNKVYKTKITQGVILICTPPPMIQFQEFIIKDKELENFQTIFLQKVEEYQCKQELT